MRNQLQARRRLSLFTRFLGVAVTAILGSQSTSAVPVRPVVEGVEKAFDAAAEVSGKVLPRSRRAVARKATEEAAKHRGDSAVLHGVGAGAPKLTGAAARYGDDTWKLVSKVPASSRVAALHADDLAPLVRRLGPDVLALESKVPGISKRLVTMYGDDAVHVLARSGAVEDAPRLVGIGAKADSLKTRERLFEYYRKDPTILERLPARHILAGGLTAAMLTAAWKAGNGVHDSLVSLSKNSPELLSREMGRTARTAIWPVLVLVLLPVAALAIPLSRRLWRRFSPRP